MGIKLITQKIEYNYKRLDPYYWDNLIVVNFDHEVFHLNDLEEWCRKKDKKWFDSIEGVIGGCVRFDKWVCHVIIRNIESQTEFELIWG